MVLEKSPAGISYQLPGTRHSDHNVFLSFLGDEILWLSFYPTRGLVVSVFRADRLKSLLSAINTSLCKGPGRDGFISRHSGGRTGSVYRHGAEYTRRTQ